MSDPGSKHWLADDPRFLDSLGDLDRGLRSADEPVEPDEAADAAPIDALTPPAVMRERDTPPRAASRPPGPAAARAGRPIDAARATDASRGLDTRPPARVAMHSSAPPPAASEMLTQGDVDALPPFLFTQPATGDRLRRPLIDIFPLASLEPEAPIPPAVATAAPQRSRLAPPREAPTSLDAPTYESFYGLHEAPFSLSTDPRFHHQSASHERAGQEILGAIRVRGGVVVLTAPLGMGKATLCRSLIADLDPGTVASLVVEPIHSINELLKTMLADFGVMAREDLAAAPNVSREVLLGTLSAFLESLAGVDAAAVVFLDEAQNLPISLLGELAVVIGAPGARVLQLVLVGQPALQAVMNHRDVRALTATVSRRITLGPLTAGEIASYVTHRLAIAGANTRVEFDEAAIAQLFELSAGSPRLVNLLCDRAMTRGHAASAAVIDLPLVEAAAHDLDLEPPAPDRPGALASLLIIVMFALLVIAGGAGAVWVFHDAVHRTIQEWEKVPLPPGGPIHRLPVPLAPIPPPAGDAAA